MAYSTRLGSQSPDGGSNSLPNLPHQNPLLLRQALACDWAATMVEDPSSSLIAASRAEMAARYQVVSRFSGAVVLETTPQYDDHDLKPVHGDASPSIPNIPELSTSLLVMLAASAALLKRERKPGTPTSSSPS